MTVKFKTAAGTPKISSGPAVVQFFDIQGGENAAGDVFTELPGAGATGSFQGTDNGGFDIFFAQFGPFSGIVKQCSSAAGLATLKFGAGSTVNLG